MELETADRLVREVLDIVRRSESELWATIQRRLASGQTLDETGWLALKQRELARLTKDLERIVRRLDKNLTAGVPKMVEDAYRHGWAAAALPGEEAIGIGFAVSRNRLEALAAETLRNLDPILPQILRSAEDVFRNVVGETAGLVVSGSQTLGQAADRSLARFASKGIGSFRDRAGREWALDVYTDMALRSSVVRTSAAATIDRTRERGDDLLIVSDSPEECPLCRPWERRILSISGGDNRYPLVSTAISEGLLHPNCTHSLTPYVKGQTIRGRADANPQGYEQRQEQRYLERNIRAWQRRELAAVTPDARAQARRKVREWQSRHRRFLDETGRRRTRRASIPKIERSK